MQRNERTVAAIWSVGDITASFIIRRPTIGIRVRTRPIASDGSLKVGSPGIHSRWHYRRVRRTKSARMEIGNVRTF